MKLTRQQLRDVIIKEFKMDNSNIDIGDIIRGGGFPPQSPPESHGGGGGGSKCEDPSDRSGKFDKAYNKTLDSFELFLMLNGLDYLTYFKHLSAREIPHEVSMSFLSDVMLYEIALSLCKGKVKFDMLHSIFNNPKNFV